MFIIHFSVSFPSCATITIMWVLENFCHPKKILHAHLQLTPFPSASPFSVSTDLTSLDI